MDFELELVTGDALSHETDLIVLVVPREDGDPNLERLPDLPEPPLSSFDAAVGETRLVYGTPYAAPRVLLVGCGSPEDLEAAQVAELAGRSIQAVTDEPVEEATFVFPLFWSLDREVSARQLRVGLQLAGYRYEQYQHDDEEDEDNQPELERVHLLLEDRRSLATVTRGFEEGASTARAVASARDLGNTPSNDLTPEGLAEHARTLADEHDQLEVDVWEPDRLQEESMNLILAVGRGSGHEPRLIRLDHRVEDPDGSVALVGKGVTFDSGGISIKPSKDMDEMKFDMCGAAAVLGIMEAVARLEWPLDVVGLVPSAENMPGERAAKPGDVVTGYAGRSVEILNTDAEGRLIMADTLGYVSDTLAGDVDYLIDYATLTGACITALGHEAAGLMGIDDDLCDRLEAAGQMVSERVWRLPLWEEHSEQMESEIADVKNIGGKAGAITAGAFLRHFVDEDEVERWAHLDIAGTGWGMKELSYRPKGGTGFGVRLTVQLLRDLYRL